MKGKNKISSLLILVIALLLMACNSEVTSSDQNEEQLSSELEPVFMNSDNGVTKSPISGTIQRSGAGLPERAIITPGGPCHFFNLLIFTEYTGDLEGPVDFNEDIHQKCTGGRLIASGPFAGEITWNGRTGTISGQFTTNCEPDPSQPAGVSCDGTATLRGSGELEGVQFHYTWGPGWYPFSYSGTAFSK